MTHELDFLRAESARLIALLESHAIEWQRPPVPKTESPLLTTEDKIALFRLLFRGRTDLPYSLGEQGGEGRLLSSMCQ